MSTQQETRIAAAFKCSQIALTATEAEEAFRAFKFARALWQLAWL